MKKNENKFLFILSPPYCGTTLLSIILSSSKSVSINNSFGTREGQFLPGVEPMMFTDRRWDESFTPDWEAVKKKWLNYWDITLPVLLEKSPPNMIRSEEISRYFDPSYFIILHRNPYAHCDSIMRRHCYSPQKAAEHVIGYLKCHKKNLKLLPHSIRISYEELTEAPLVFSERIAGFMPELSDIKIDMNKKLNTHNFKQKNLKITNLNQEKIDHLSKSDLSAINSIFEKDQEYLKFFGYNLIY